MKTNPFVTQLLNKNTLSSQHSENDQIKKIYELFIKILVFISRKHFLQMTVYIIQQYSRKIVVVYKIYI